MHDSDEQEEALLPSKSARKREMQAMRELGEQLLALADSHSQRLPLSDTLRDALALHKRLKQGEAKKRQLRYIGKMLLNEPLDDIQAVLTQIENESKLFRHHFHLLERLRDDLLFQGDEPLFTLLDKHPQLDRQHLRQLIRQARKENAANKPPAASRKLFRYLRENIEIGEET